MKAFYRLFYYISIVLTSILAGVTIAGAFVGNAAPDSFKFMPFIGLILPILLLANLASAIYWTIRWRCWVFIPLIAIFSNWGYISCVLQSPFFSPASSPMVKMNVYTPGVLTVATYNVDAFNHEHTGYSCKEIASYMRNLQADILCFQEFGINDEFGIDSIYAALSNWPYHYIPSSPEGKNLLQLAVFSRYPIKEEHLIIYPDSKNCSLACDIEINGRTIRLFNNHLQTTEVSQNKRKLEKGLRTDDSQRVEHAALGLIDGLHENFRKRAVQADLLKQLIAASPYPTLVCGDFNSLPSSYVYHTIKGDKLPADKKAPIEAALQKLKDAHKAQDLAAIDTAMAEINTAFQAASAEMYAQGGAQGGAQAGPDMNGGAGQQDNSKHGDNVQDADFEEVK